MVDVARADLVAWTLADHLNTVRDIAKYDPQTGTTTVVNHLVYDAFGRVTSESNTAVDSLFLFTARPFDVDAGLQNNLNRWYDRAVGRWLSEDPIGFGGEDGNLYRYIHNNVVLWVDPQGLQIPPINPIGPGRPPLGVLDGVHPPQACPQPPASPSRPTGLPGELHNLWRMESSACTSCTKAELESLLQAIQTAIDNTWVWPFWPGQCQRWINEFERNLPNWIAIHPCVREANMGWESSPYLGGGHAFYYFILRDGTRIRVDNGYTTGSDHYDISKPEEE